MGGKAMAHSEREYFFIFKNWSPKKQNWWWDTLCCCSADCFLFWSRSLYINIYRKCSCLHKYISFLHRWPNIRQDAAKWVVTKLYGNSPLSFFLFFWAIILKLYIFFSSYLPPLFFVSGKQMKSCSRRNIMSEEAK